MKRKIIAIVLIIVIGIVTRFWLGIYEHNEFYSSHIFIKHRPIWKWKFYSPIGMGELDKLTTPEKRNEYRLFNEFIIQKGLSR